MNLAQVRLNQNTERDAIAALKRDLIRTITDTETAYWRLARARYDLLILQRLYDRGVQVRDELVSRSEIVRDVSAAQVADAQARVERRRADVLRAQPALVDQWDLWSGDQRWTPSAYVEGTEGGWYDAGRRHVRVHADRAGAVADLIRRMAAWLARGEVTAVDP